MAGLLDMLMNGGLPPENDPQEALLSDLLKRLGDGSAQAGSVAITPKLGALAGPAPMQPPTPQAGVRAPDDAGPPAPLATREVAPMPQVGQPYTAPDAPVAMERRMEQTAARMPMGMAPPSPPQRPAAPAESEMSFAERLTALGQGYNRGGLVGAIGEAMGGAQDNATVRAVMKNMGVDQDTARAISKTPQLAQYLFGSKAAPQIVKIPGPYGTEVDMYWNPKSQRLEPLSNLMGHPAQVGALPSAPMPPALNMGTAPAATPGAGPGGVPAAPLAKNVAPNMTEDGRYVIGNNVPKAPEGYVHRLAPNGTGYLWDQNGRPVFELKAEAENRAKAPAGYEWVDAADRSKGVRKIPGQESPIPGEVAGKVAMMNMARERIARTRGVFERDWGTGDITKWTAANVPVVGDVAMLSGDVGMAKRDIETGIEAALRTMTGAAAPEPEVARYARMFLPGPQDTKESATQKIDGLMKFMETAERLVTQGRGTLSIGEATKALDEAMNPGKTAKPAKDVAIAEARKAIAEGKDPVAIRARLKGWGYGLE